MTRGEWRHGMGRALAVILTLAVAARAGLLLALPIDAWLAGGDGPWYAHIAWLLAHGQLDAPPRTIAPAYPVVLAAIWRLLPGHPDPEQAGAIAASFLWSVRCAQALLGAVTAALVYRIARRLDVSPRPALAGALGVALGPAFVIEPFLLHTETLFMAVLAAAVLLAVRAVEMPSAGRCAAAGVGAALIALSRPVGLTMPVVFAAILLGRGRDAAWRRGAAILLLVATIVLLPAHAWWYGATGVWLPEGLTANLMLGAYGDEAPTDRQAFHDLESRLVADERGYLDEAARRIGAHPLAWVRLRLTATARAFVQPHGTSDLGGPSAKAALLDWYAHDRSPAGLWRLAGSVGFALRLMVYLFHYAALGLALAGAARTWRQRRWRPVLVPIAVLVLIYALLQVTPRYLFSVEALLWVLAAAALDVRRPGAAARPVPRA
jgi:4-amino-4-deoxy-L-arabinose transferase-like glycosyltransferase